MQDARGTYEDFCLHSGNTEDAPPLAGVCHARGANSAIPPIWIPYFVVEDLAQALTRAKEQGGEVFDGPRSCGGAQQMAFIRDLDGATFALVGS